MSSGFVPAGAGDDPPPEDDAWRQARQDVEATRERRKQDAEEAIDGKTLYEVLQQNKAAKQEAFEESIRLKNQFRTLDEEEVEFLDFVLESTRAKEEAVKSETRSQVDAFRRRQDEADQGTGQNEELTSGIEGRSPSTADDHAWKIAPKKRKRNHEGRSGSATKLRKPSVEDTTSEPTLKPRSTQDGDDAGGLENSGRGKDTPSKPGTQASGNALGLGAYDSDDNE